MNKSDSVKSFNGDKKFSYGTDRKVSHSRFEMILGGDVSSKGI